MHSQGHPEVKEAGIDPHQRGSADLLRRTRHRARIQRSEQTDDIQPDVKMDRISRNHEAYKLPHLQAYPCHPSRGAGQQHLYGIEDAYPSECRHDTDIRRGCRPAEARRGELADT